MDFARDIFVIMLKGVIERFKSTFYEIEKEDMDGRSVV